MGQPRDRKVQCLSPAGLHRMAYKDWGAPDNPRVLVCVHGLTETADYFDVLAQALSDDMRIVCPDVVGRGRSDWFPKGALYAIPQYVGDMVTLLAQVLVYAPEIRVGWLGTSMGGLIGMGLASLPGNPIGKLLLNDVGPVLEIESLQRIGAYVCQPVAFDDFEQAKAYVQSISQSYGELDNALLEKMTRDYMRQNDQGKWVRHYDRAIAEAFRSITPEKVLGDQGALWAAYDAIKCPTLLVRGALSDLLSVETAKAMQQRGPKPVMVEIPGVGHAPSFMTDDQIEIARKFFL